MTVDAWLKAAIEDAERRGLPELRPMLEALAQATRALREADLGERAAPAPPTRGGAR
jgi:hypothetical protein